MKYSLDAIVKCANYIKIGNTEEIVDNIEDEIGKEKYRKVIEPWLSAALQSEHLSLLVGSGLTTAVCQAAGVSASSMKPADFGAKFVEKINNYAAKSAREMGRGKPNIEDQIRTAISLLQGYEIDGNMVDADALGDAIDNVLSEFCSSILSSEYNIAEALNSTDEATHAKATEALELLKSFLSTFASRNATRERVQIITTNYDRFIEYGCDLAGIKVLDRFWGKILPRLQENPATLDYYYHVPDSRNEFRYAEGVVRFTKVHGSIDWYEQSGSVYQDALRFGAKETDFPFGSNFKDHIMIYPNSMKSVETAFYPYAELFRDFSSAVCIPNTTMFTYGYGFGDTHINKIIKEMLTVPSTHLIIVTYSLDERIISFLRELNMAQVSILAGKEFGDLKNLVKYYLPKAAIDTLTEPTSRLIESRKGILQINEEETGESINE